MVGCLAIFTILKLMQKKQKCKGEILAFYLIFYGIIRFLIEALRTDSLMLLGFRVSQIISLISIVLGITLYIKNKDKLEAK